MWLLPSVNLEAAVRILAPGMEPSVFAAHSRWVASTETKILGVPALLVRQRTRIERRCRRIVGYRLRLQTVVVSWSDRARISSEHRRGNGSGKNYRGT